MAISYVDYVGNGATTNFSVTFPYLDRDHVYAKVNGSTVSFSWVNSTTISISPAPANAARVRLYRDTPSLTPEVDFQDGAIVTEEQLDTNAKQILYVSQEAEDESAQALGPTSDGTNWDGDSKRITNVDDPVDDQDVATKAYVAQELGADYNAQAEAAAAEAEGHADDAEASALAAASAAAAAAASFDSFDDRYLGAKAVAPTLDNDGNALVSGALYYDTAMSLMRQWDGASWLDIQAGISQAAGDTRYIQKSLVDATGDLLYGSAADTVARLAIGAAGQVLGTSSGVPSWVTPSIKLTVWTANDTWVPDTNMRQAVLFTLGGGGGGGAINGTGSLAWGGGSGGGAGSWSIKLIDKATADSSKSVTIGAGGSGGAAGNNPGSAGGDTLIGSLCVGKGASGGNAYTGSSTITGGAGGVAGTGDITTTGAPGQGAGVYGSSIGGPVQGGSSIFGGGGNSAGFVSSGSGADGGNGTGYGSGGGGASSYNNGTARAGGSGAPGLAFVIELVWP